MKKSEVLRIIETDALNNEDGKMSLAQISKALDKIPIIKWEPENQSAANFHTLHLVAAHIALICQSTVEQMKSATRKTKHATARHIFVYYIRTRYKQHFSLEVIGDFLGGRDHTTAINSYNRAKDLIEAEDAYFNQCLLSCLNSLQGIKTDVVQYVYAENVSSVKRSSKEPSNSSPVLCPAIPTVRPVPIYTNISSPLKIHNS